MNQKKANWLFLSTLMAEAVLMAVLIFCGDVFKMGVLMSLFVSQLVILVPAILFLIGTRTNPFSLIQTKRIKISTALIVVVITFLCMPAIVTVNAISMLFVENTVNELSQSLISLPALAVIFMVGIFGPISEEFVFRGVIYHSYRRVGRVIGGMLLSAFLFGITHLNFNQMSYAVLVGVIGVILVECTGSILSSMIFHMVINLTNTIPMFLFPDQFAGSAEEAEAELAAMGMTYQEALYVSIGVYAVIAAIGIVLAVCLFHVIAEKEDRLEHIKTIWNTRKEGPREKLWTIPLIVSVVLCFAYMIFDVIQ